MSQTTHHTLNADGFDFAVRVYPAAEPNGSVLVWLHGGAFMFGTIDMPEADEVARRLSEIGTTVVSWTTRSAPSTGSPDSRGPKRAHRAPARSSSLPSSRRPARDRRTRRRRCRPSKHSSGRARTRTRGAPIRIGCRLGGASAGGNLSASAAVRLRDAGADAPASLLLVYPVLHSELPPADPELLAFLDELPPEQKFPPEATRAINASYLAGASPDEVYAFPGGHDMRGMPRTLIVNAERDRLRSSGEAFAADLALGGVDVTVVRERGALHGYLNQVGDPSAEHTLALVSALLSD